MINNQKKIKYERLNNESNFKSNNKIINYILIITFLFVTLFFIILLFKKNIIKTINEIFEIKQMIKNQNNSSIINETLIKELNDYINLCKNGTLIHGIHNSSITPKITALIPVYNGEKNIKATIRSIQNQNFYDLEILLVDDFSMDKSINIIEELQNEDKRIKLLKSKKNRGTLYTRSIGALNSKGKYIMPIDNDDLFIKDIFKICYEDAELNNLDIIEFSGYNTYNVYLLPNSNQSYSLNTPFYLQFKENGLLIKQPELSIFMYQKLKNTSDYILIDGLIWGKCIRNYTYKKALDLVGNIIYDEKIIWTEDRIINFALFRVASSFKFINKDGIIHYISQSSIGYNTIIERRNIVFHDELINVMNILNITKNSDDEKFALIELKNTWKLYFYGLNEENKKLAMNLYFDVVNCTHILSESKEELAQIVKETLKKENELFRYYHKILD